MVIFLYFLGLNLSNNQIAKELNLKQSTATIEQVEGYLELDKIKNIHKLRSFLLIGSKNGVEFLEIRS